MDLIRRPNSRSRRRGAMDKGCLITVVSVIVILLVFGGCGVGKYNGIIAMQAGVEAGWSAIQNQYQRRFDLVPQLVNTVKGAADFEKSTITAVTDARASVGKMALPSDLPDDPQKLQAFFKAQDQLGASLSRLLVTVEAYPQLKASQNFLSLQDQLEGNENRISVARRDYIDAVKAYNVSIRAFPGNLLAGMFGFEKHPQLEFDTAVTERPDVDFDFGGE